MGLSDGAGGSGGATMVSVIGGKFTIRCEEGDAGAKPRELTKGPHEGDTVFEKGYKELAGRLIGGFTNTTDYGENGLTKLIDDESGEEFILSLPTDNRFFTEFAKRLPNIDPRIDVTLIIGIDKEKKTKTGGNVFYLLVKQGDEIIKPAFTREEPGDCPEAVQKRGKWNFDDQVEFLIELYEQWFTDNGEEKDGNQPATKPEQTKTQPKKQSQAKKKQADDPADDYEDDIPF